MAKFVTDASGATWWSNLAFFLLAEEITQVKEAIPWVRCASGNVSHVVWNQNFEPVPSKHFKHTHSEY